VSLGANEENAPIAINSAGEIAVGGQTDGLPSVILPTGVNGSQVTPSIVLAGTDRELNDNGDIIGTSGGQPAIELANGTVKVLPLLNAGDTATPTPINDNDEVVGRECTPALVAILGGDSSILARSLAAKVYVYLEDVLGIQHPDTVPWVLDGDVLSNAKLDLLKDHLDGGELLGVFGADGSVRAAYWNPFLTVFDPETKGGYIFFQGAYNNPYAKLIASTIQRLQGP
jgi:hypothetical protein